MWRRTANWNVNVGFESLCFTGHFKNNGNKFSEKIRGGGVAVHVNVCRLESHSLVAKLT